ncbi:MAG: hypothetical protein AAF811_10365 [Pseudomonadota bacterium]
MAPPSTDLPARATVCQRLCFLSNSLHADAQQQDYTARYVGEDLSEDARSAVHARMRAHYAMLDAAIAENGGGRGCSAPNSACTISTSAAVSVGR